jgi:hypothetical protein
MSILTFNNDIAVNSLSNQDVLAAFKQYYDKPKEIKQGMSPDEIADIVSDRLIEVVKHQFAEAKKQFGSKAKK